MFWLTKPAKSSRNLVGKLENSPECSCSSGGSGFTSFEEGDSKPTQGFGARDPRPTTGAVGSGGRGSGTGGLGRWLGGLDCPKVSYVIIPMVIFVFILDQLCVN